jgi:hypothetical protein
VAQRCMDISRIRLTAHVAVAAAIATAVLAADAPRAAASALSGIPCAAATATVTEQARTEAPSYNIYELQHSGPEYDWQSPHAGEIVKCVGGIVTHKFQQRIVMQDPSQGDEWAAIEVRGYPVYPTGIAIGDQADFDSVYVDEYRGVTTLQYYNASSHVVNSSGHALPAALPISVWDVRYPAHPEDTERLAAMLVVVDERMAIGALDLGAHEDNYELLGVLGETAWGSDYANTEISSTYYVSSGECYARIVGIVQRYDNDAEWDYYQLLPRMNADYVPCGTAVDSNPDAARFRLVPLRSNPGLFPAGIAYELPLGTPVRLEVLDASGRRVDVLVDGWREAGRHEATWRSGDVPSGLYYVRLRAAGEDLVRRLCVLH